MSLQNRGPPGSGPRDSSMGTGSSLGVTYFVHKPREPSGRTPLHTSASNHAEKKSPEAQSTTAPSLRDNSLNEVVKNL